MGGGGGGQTGRDGGGGGGGGLQGKLRANEGTCAGCAGGRLMKSFCNYTKHRPCQLLLQHGTGSK